MSERISPMSKPSITSSHGINHEVVPNASSKPRQASVSRDIPSANKTNSSLVTVSVTVQPERSRRLLNNQTNRNPLLRFRSIIKNLGMMLVLISFFGMLESILPQELTLVLCLSVYTIVGAVLVLYFGGYFFHLFRRGDNDQDVADDMV